MTLEKRVAVVTGGNRGIGLEVCRQLAQKDIQVILTARDSSKGETAVQQLKQEGIEVQFAPLEVSNERSIHQLIQYLRQEIGKVDILVNNAGIFPDDKSPEGNSIFAAKPEILRTAMETNVYGPLMLCQQIIPLMRENNYGRIVNVSSGMGQLSDMGSGSPAYRLSKVSLNALTRIFNNELQGDNILMNSVCPGWVRTDMGGPNATRDLATGADTIVWLALLEDGGPRGQFFRDRKVIPW